MVRPLYTLMRKKQLRKSRRATRRIRRRRGGAQVPRGKLRFIPKVFYNDENGQRTLNSVQITQIADTILDWFRERANESTEYGSFEVILNPEFSHIRDNIFQLDWYLPREMNADMEESVNLDLELLLDPDEDGNNTLQYNGQNWLVMGVRQ